MPDDQDHAELARLLRDPRGWTAPERAHMGWLLAHQTNQLDAAHPADRRGRSRLQAVVDDLTAAIAVADGAGDTPTR